MTTDVSKLLTVAEVPKRSPLSEPAIRSRITDGRLTAIRIGGSIYLDESELRAKLGDKFQPRPAK
jgi:hypothetical protein